MLQINEGKGIHRGFLDQLQWKRKIGFNKLDLCSNMMFESTIFFMKDIWKTYKDETDSQIDYFYTKIQDYQIKLKAGVRGYYFYVSVRIKSHFCTLGLKLDQK